jgi:hypothetical protein
MLAGLSSACQKFRSDDPVNAYIRFHQTVEKKDFKSASRLLSQKTVELLEARDVSGDDAAQIFLAGSETKPVTQVKRIRDEGEAAVVSVEWSGRKADVRMVKESGAWKVDFSEVLSVHLKQ